MLTILLCGNGRSGEVIPQIKSWGYQVALISEFPEDCGTNDADFYREADSKDPEQALQAALDLSRVGVRFNGVMSLCWDSAVSVARIAEHFGLFSVSSAVAENCTLKDKRSRAFLHAAVPAPSFSIIKNITDLESAIRLHALPAIIKPTDQSSSRGVTKVTRIEEWPTAYEHAMANSGTRTCVANEFIEGTEHSIEGLMIDREFHMTGFSDRNFKYEEYSPYFVEVGDTMPSALAKAEIDIMRRITEHAALALEITDGVVKGDLIRAANGAVYVLEITCRMGGPRFGTEMVPLSNGTSLLKAALQQCTGQSIDLTLLRPRYMRGMVNRSIFPQPGRVKSLEGLETIKKLPGFYDFKWWKRPIEPGDIISRPDHGCGSVGYIIATGSNADEASKNADLIEQTIKITTF